VVVFRVPRSRRTLLRLRTTEDVFLLAWGTDKLNYRAEDLDRIRRWTGHEVDWARLLRLHHAVRPKPKGKPTYRLLTRRRSAEGTRIRAASRQGRQAVPAVPWRVHRRTFRSEEKLPRRAFTLQVLDEHLPVGPGKRDGLFPGRLRGGFAFPGFAGICLQPLLGQKPPAGHKVAVMGLAYVEGGKMLVSGDRDGVLLMHEVSSGKIRGRLEKLGKVVGVALSPDGKRLAVARADRVTVRAVERWLALGRPGGRKE
jgi:hypothetical protein